LEDHGKSPKSEPSKFDEYNKKKVAELRELCTAKGLSNKGLKAELIKNLINAER